MTPASTPEQQRRFPFRNEAGESIPAFAVVELIEFDLDQQVWAVRKPTTDNATCDVAVNCELAVPAGSYGLLTMDFPSQTLCDGFDSGSCGVRANRWDMSSVRAGFLAIGGAAANTAMVVKCL